jgi:hypothetical protein
MRSISCGMENFILMIFASGPKRLERWSSIFRDSSSGTRHLSRRTKQLKGQLNIITKLLKGETVGDIKEMIREKDRFGEIRIVTHDGTEIGGELNDGKNKWKVLDLIKPEIEGGPVRMKIECTGMV